MVDDSTPKPLVPFASQSPSRIPNSTSSSTEVRTLTPARQMSDPLTGAPLKWRDPQTLPRGYGYPETGTDLVKGFTDQQQLLRHSDPAYTPSDFLKPHFSSKYQWDGSVTMPYALKY